MTINLTNSQKLVSPGWDWQKTQDFPKLRFVWLCIIVKLSILVGMLLFHLKLPSFIAQTLASSSPDQLAR